MSNCTGLFPHSIDSENCSVCRKEALLKMKQEANVDFLFSDIKEDAITKFNADMYTKAQKTIEAIKRGEALPVEPLVRKTKWYERWKYAIKWRLQNWLTSLEIWVSEW